MASLVADYSSSGESDDEIDSDSGPEIEEEIKQQNGNTAEKLPRPEFGLSGSTAVKNSVFSNPFVEAENAKKAILEKHVKMTPTRDEVKMINGKKICWNFRKGRCRFGHNCKFAHDSDLQRSEADSQENSEQVPLPNQISPPVGDEEAELDEENTKTQIVRKKRPGLTQSLVPGKKVMKMYKKQSSLPFATTKVNR
ncbi:hypothetical protein C0J52_23009 [Blattella germanica]|nr:hypothetical protein C0J52_23009 [Blattella germanica]